MSQFSSSKLSRALAMAAMSELLSNVDGNWSMPAALAMAATVNGLLKVYQRTVTSAATIADSFEIEQ